MVVEVELKAARKTGPARAALVAGLAILVLGGALVAFVVTRDGPADAAPAPAAPAPHPPPVLPAPPPVGRAPTPAAAPPVASPAPAARPPASVQADASAALAALRPQMATGCKVTAGRFRFHLVFDASGREAARSVIGLDAEGRKAAGCLIRMAPGSLRIPAPGRRVSTAVNVTLP